MQTKEILTKLDLGSSVAEFDNALERYFVETETFRAVIADKGDVIAGDKGTGKTALYQILQRRYRQIPELKDVEILSGFNASGNPVFQRLAQGATLPEGQYSVIWKAYIVSLIGNWLLGIYDETSSHSLRQLHEFLVRIGLRTQDYTPQTVFSKIVNAMWRVLKPRSAEIEISASETGVPTVTPKIDFGPAEHASSTASDLSFATLEDIESGLRLLNQVLEEIELQVWVVLDRLDEAFQGFPHTEVPALRALFRTYLDLLEFRSLRLKLFVRRDLFRRIIRGGFVNLTHINARKIEIVWDPEDLFVLLCARMRENPDFIQALGLTGSSNGELFDRVFPDQVTPGEKRPDTWKWMISRISDGNGVIPPRNLVDLAKKSQEAQLRREERVARPFNADTNVFEPEAIRRAHESLSDERVQDTLLAEAGDLANFIQKFRDGKAEHNLGSLISLFGCTSEEANRIAKSLMEVGFLEQIGESYKVPPLYRPGLGISQGKAF